jgi:hypothetical protein
MYRANRRPFNSDGAISLTIKFASLNSIEIWAPRLCSTNRASCPTPCISTFPPPDEGGASASLFAAAAIEGVIMMTARYVSFSSGKAFCHTINIEFIDNLSFIPGRRGNQIREPNNKLFLRPGKTAKIPPALPYPALI